LQFKASLGKKKTKLQLKKYAGYSGCTCEPSYMGNIHRMITVPGKPQGEKNLETLSEK
jgi:hypothetical protein